MTGKKIAKETKPSTVVAKRSRRSEGNAEEYWRLAVRPLEQHSCQPDASRRSGSSTPIRRRATSNTAPPSEHSSASAQRTSWKG